jgi:DNA-directed RNA polymerase specialized sigma24 family protein
MLVGRAPSILAEPLMRGFASHRPVETFEDCVIFVLDMESALARLSRVDRLLLTKIVLQEYSISETALLLDKPHRIVYRRLADALDRLTRILLGNGTLKIPHRKEPAPDDELDE